MAEVPKSGNVASLVTNVEVMHMLRAKLEARQAQDELLAEEQEDGTMQLPKRPKQLWHRDWIEQTVHDYLQTTACAQTNLKQLPELVQILKRPTEAQRGGVVEVDLDEVQEEAYGLTDAETLQTLNMLPSEPVELHLIVQDINARLSEEKQTQMLETVAKYKNKQEEVEEFMIDDDEA